MSICFTKLFGSSRSSRIPATSVSNISFSAPSAAANSPATVSALMLYICSDLAVGAGDGERAFSDGYSQLTPVSYEARNFTTMAFPASYSAIDDKDFDDAALWAVIDSAAAAAVSSSKTRKSLALNCLNKPNPSPPPKYPKSPMTPAQRSSRVLAEGEVVQEPWVFQPPRKIARTCSSEVSESSPLAVVCNNAVRTPVRGPVYLSPEAFLSPQMGSGSEGSPASCGSGLNEGSGIARHSLSGQFPSVSLFKEYQNAAMAILEKSDFTMIAGNPFIKKSGWRKISFYFNLSFEIKDKTIEFDENRNVQRAEFVVRAYMQGGRFCDGWGSCERREKRFIKPNHDIPSTAETRAKNKACQDLLGIGEYRPGACQGQK